LQRLPATLDIYSFVALEQLPHPEIDQICRTGVLDDAERECRGDDDGGEAGGGCSDVHKRPEVDAGNRCETDAASLFGALNDDVEHRRPGNDEQRQRCQREEPERGGAWKGHGYHSAPCGGTTSRRSAAR
jgi:hypothetical protein